MLLHSYRLLSVIVFCYVQCIGSWGISDFKLKIPKFNSFNPYCHVKECCNDDWIHFNKARLIRNLTDQVYGQPLLETVVDALSAHFNPNFPPTKPLTLSFNGMIGTGKNYVAKFIMESIYNQGAKSKYVHHFIGRMHFSEENKMTNLYAWLKGNVSECPKQLFIFDDVDKMTPEVLNIIKPLIDYRHDVDGVSFSQSVFLFLSNTGSDIINEHFHGLYIKDGRRREDLTMADFERFIQRGAFNEKGGLTSNLIDYYIPFLPLEEKHIIMCIKAEFRARKVFNPSKEHIEEIKKSIEWGPHSSKIFSKAGCKRLGSKVAFAVEKHYRHLAFDSKDEL